MKISCSKEDLSQGVSTIQTALSARTTLPILLNFLIETEKAKLKFVSTDLEMGVRHYLAADVQSEGSITIPAKKFADILHSLPEDREVEISVDSGNHLYLSCGKSRFKIVGAPKSEYPVLPDLNKQGGFEIPASALAGMIDKTLFAASSDETRRVLNGVFWSAKKGLLEMVATDGRRLAIVMGKGLVPADKDFQAIVPTKILSELQKLVGPGEGKDKAGISVMVTDNQITFQFKNTTILSRLVGGEFPNYRQVIPANSAVSAALDTKELLAVTKRASLCAQDRGGAVKYVWRKGSVQVSAQSQNIEFNDEIPADYKGEEFPISFNPAFVIDALKHVDSEKTVVSMTPPLHPAVFEPAGTTGYRFVVMPMRG